MTKIAIVGAGGRMGRTLVQAVHETEGLALGAATERAGSSLIGADAGELAAIGRIGIALVEDLGRVVDDFDVVIDFTRPEATMAHLALCQSRASAW